MLKSLLYILTILCISINVYGQYLVQGAVIDELSGQPISGAEVQLLPGNPMVVTTTNGSFIFQDVEEGDYILRISYPEHTVIERNVVVSDQNVNLGRMNMAWVATKGQGQTALDDRSAADNIPTITLSEDDFSDDLDGAQNISGLLTSSDDVFIRAAAFNWSAARFRIRGFGSQYSEVYLNGAPMNDFESNSVYWGLWGGLNDVVRNRDNDIGIGFIDNAFGGLNGASHIDLRPSKKRPGLRVSYANSNRTYRHRIMTTYTSPLNDKGWAYTISGSRRWAQEGYIEGTSYDAWSYFLGVEKVINETHTLGVSFFGAPNRRGKSYPAIQELYDIAGSNFYNSNWGWQEGEKRNTRMAHTHEPVAILRHDWTFEAGKSWLTTSVSLQKGTNGSTALNWAENTPDPRPNYYRKLPSGTNGDFASESVRESLIENPEKLQYDFNKFYQDNYLNFYEVENANGIQGNTVSGLRSLYMIEDRRYDGTQFALRTNYTNILNDRWQFNGGLQFVAFQTDNFKILDDLLGADYWVDIDRFLLFDVTLENADPIIIANDISTPNKVVREGDRFEYSYTTNGRNAGVWGQLQYSGGKWDAFFSGELEYSSFWRDGEWANGKFPTNSQGKSEVSEWLTYGLKAGATYKIDGRNYVYANITHQTIAPTVRNAFISPRTRNTMVPGLETEKVSGIEGGYVLTAPSLKVRLTGYAFQIQDQFFNRSFFLDAGGFGNGVINSLGQEVDLGFVNYIMTGINKFHRGIEAAAAYSLFNNAWTVSGAASLASFQHTNRPTARLLLDQTQTFIGEERTIYIENFYESGIPQTALSLGLNYSGKYWWASLTANYYDHTYMGFNPDRRRTAAIRNLEPGSELYNEVLFQEKAPSAYTLDFFGGKSFKFGDTFIQLILGVNNILDDQDIRTGGFEQFRFNYVRADDNASLPDVGRFPNRYFYMFGRNYFASITISLD